MDRAPGRQVLRDGAPLTPGAEDVHHPVRHLADIDRALVASGLGRRNQRPDLAPLHLGQIAFVARMPAVIAASVLPGPRPSIPPNSGKEGKNGNGFNEFKRGWLTNSKNPICYRTDLNKLLKMKGI